MSRKSNRFQMMTSKKLDPDLEDRDFEERGPRDEELPEFGDDDTEDEDEEDLGDVPDDEDDGGRTSGGLLRRDWRHGRRRRSSKLRTVNGFSVSGR